MSDPTTAPSRRHDLDWLRIGAFGLLILYHIGMVFVPWPFHIKSAPLVRWLEAPMLLLNAWRLALLFVVSGAASRMMLRRASAGGFASSRSRRLLIPLAAGLALWVAPQAWVDLRVNHGYAAGFGWFWLHDNFRFDAALGIALPTWNHLWFVAYLWTYSMALAALWAVPALRRRGQAAFDRLFGGWRLLALPTLWFALARILLADRFPENHGLFGDWYAHAIYGFAFLFGVGLGGSRTLWPAIARWWRPAGAAALAGWAVVAAATLATPEDAEFAAGPLLAVRLARAVQAWGSIIALLGFAQAHLNRDHRWRATLNEAVFPAYIAHQTIIIVAMFWLLPIRLPAAAEFAVLLAATIAGCAAFYLGGRAIPWLRPLIGLRYRSANSRRRGPM